MLHNVVTNVVHMGVVVINVVLNPVLVYHVNTDVVVIDVVMMLVKEQVYLVCMDVVEVAVVPSQSVIILEVLLLILLPIHLYLRHSLLP